MLWFSRLDDAENEKIESIVFMDETVGLSLRQFRCLRIDVETIEDPKLREQYGKYAPMFVTFTPKGEVIGRVHGKSTASLSSVRKLVQKSFTRVYETRNREFCQEMTSILDRIDVNAGRRTTLQAKLDRYAEKGHQRRVEKIKRELAECDEEDQKIAEAEKELLGNCELRDEFREDEASE